MQSILTKITEIKANPNNPRIIKDDKFAKLVKSIKEFPKMLEIRPIVVNDDMVVLGWNMRLKACKEAGLKEVHIVRASDLTEDEQKRFIISDNSGFWEWDMEAIANEWSDLPLDDWGVDLPDFNSLDDKFSLPDWEKWIIETVTFTVHKDQNEIIEDALSLSKSMWDFWDTWNDNSNWNAIARICELFLSQNK